VNNILLRRQTSEDIEAQVSKLLKDLGNPEPPLRLEDVRERLRLDKFYYQNPGDSILRETVHRLKVAGKQVLARPAILGDAIRKLDLKALYLPDRKRILLDASLPIIKQRWSEAHEIGHDIIPWHQFTMMGDDRNTLTLGCHEQIEAEANYAAGQMLFLQERFLHELRSREVAIQTILDMKKLFGNTITTTLWKFVEQAGECLVGAISVHPHRTPSDFDPDNPLRYFVRSPSFLQEFPNVTECSLFPEIKKYCRNSRGGSLGESEIILANANGEKHVFHFHTFFNSYDALTLGRYLRPQAAFLGQSVE
jgi:hypothetical protein